MSDGLQRRHALASFLDGNGAPEPDRTGAQLQAIPHYGYLNLRGDPNSEQFLQVVQATLGQPFPIVPNTFTATAHTQQELQRGRISNPPPAAAAHAQRGRISNPSPAESPAATPSCAIYWLGPDEWLLATELGREKDLAAQLGKNLAGQPHSLVDVTGGQLLMRLTGQRAREVLAKGCTLDLHPRAFKVGQCAQTTLAKASMLIALADDTPAFDIIVRRSFAEYAARWLRHSGVFTPKPEGRPGPLHP